MSCEKCIKNNTCDSFTKELISAILDGNDEEDIDMEKLCDEYTPDPTEDIGFIVNIVR